MAFKVSDYGSGALGDVTEITKTVNSYARVTAISGADVTINADTKIDGMATFTAGAKVLIHVSAAASENKVHLGRYLLANVTSVAGNVLTLNQDVTANLLSAEDFAQYYVQAIAVAQFKNLTLETGTTITPPMYSASSYHGGIVAIMCSEKLTFDGGHIALSERGIPTASSALRPATNNDIPKDRQMYAGWENSDTQYHFLLNCGDGAAFIIANEMVGHADSRIGNVTTFGVHHYRGSADSVTYGEAAPSNVTNVGGSTILIAAKTITNFSPKMIAKYRSKSSAAGAGVCRCYIASETKLRNDEGLYAYDVISNPLRVRDLGIKNFGNGGFGDLVNITSQLNNYATITAIDGTKVTYSNATTNGLAQISSGALVMIHFNHKDSNNVVESGRFILAKVLKADGTTLILDTAPPAISTTDYAAQVIAIPQCNNFTLTGTNSATPQFNGAQGGIFAVVVKNDCDISGGKILVQNKGGGAAYGYAGLSVIGNAQNCDKLPIGQGNGSVFILAKNLTMNTSTRIGNDNAGTDWNGNYVGGTITSGIKGSFHGANYRTRINDIDYRATEGWYNYGAHHDDNIMKNAIAGGNGAATETHALNNFRETLPKPPHPQGAHIMIIAEQITNFCLHAISTGGVGQDYKSGAGYGGHARWHRRFKGNDEYATYLAHCGGSSGWAFIYCQKAVDQNTAATVLDN